MQTLLLDRRTQDTIEGAVPDGEALAGLVRFYSIFADPTRIRILSALAITGFIGGWNDYMTYILYMPDYPTIAAGMYSIEQSLFRTGQVPIYFAALVLSISPVLIVFALFSNTIMKNFTMGGLKG